MLLEMGNGICYSRLLYRKTNQFAKWIRLAKNMMHIA